MKASQKYTLSRGLTALEKSTKFNWVMLFVLISPKLEQDMLFNVLVGLQIILCLLSELSPFLKKRLDAA